MTENLNADDPSSYDYHDVDALLNSAFNFESHYPLDLQPTETAPNLLTAPFTGNEAKGKFTDSST